jgi:hypothetical protein
MIAGKLRCVHTELTPGGARINLVEGQFLHWIVLSVSSPKHGSRSPGRWGNERIAHLEMMAFAVLKKKISGQAANFMIDVDVLEWREELGNQ